MQCPYQERDDHPNIGLICGVDMSGNVWLAEVRRGGGARVVRFGNLSAGGESAPMRYPDTLPGSYALMAAWQQLLDTGRVPEGR